MYALAKKLEEHNIYFEENVSLKEKTWIKTGGRCRLWITPDSVERLKVAIEILNTEHVAFEIVGHTSNIYYLDDYNPKVILSTIKVKSLQEMDDYLECACGTSVSRISRYCVGKGYKGYAGLVNLPGTLGGGICNNSSCFDCSISEHLIDAIFYDLGEKKIVNLKPNDFDFSYRNSKLKRKELNGVLLSVKLDKIPGSVDEENAKAAEATRIRKQTQEPPAYTLGSVYAGLSPKDDMLAKIARIGGFVMKLLRLHNKSRYIKFVLWLYGFGDIKDFVSSRVINTFKWLPNRTDKHEKFLRYQSFMNKVYKYPRLEIEIRSKD